MNPLYSSPKSISAFLIALEEICKEVFWTVLNSTVFPHLSYADICSQFSDNGHNRRLSNPYCDALFTCPDAAVIPN
jgi:hypothetical protein